MTNLVLTCFVTAYVWTGNPCSDGTMPRIGTCAAPRSIPMHSHVVIDGRTFLVTDRTSKRLTNTFDLFCPSYKDAIKFGRKRKAVEIIP